MTTENQKTITAEMIAELRKPLPAEAIKPHPTKNYLSTIKVPYIIERLNEVFGLAGWEVNDEIIEAGEKMIVVKSRFTAAAWGIKREAFGGNDNADRGDAYKGACTDALSKIGSYLYIGMDVYKGLGDKPSKDAKAEAKKAEPMKLKGIVSKLRVVEAEDGESEVQVLIDGKVCFASQEPNRTKLINHNESGLAAEFVVMPTARKLNDAAKTPMFSVHTVSPIPTQVPDDKLGAALKQSVDHLASQKSIEHGEKAANSFLDEEIDPHRAAGLVKNIRKPVGKGALFVEIVSGNGTVASLSTFSKTLQKRLEDSVNQAVVLRYKRSDDGKYMNLTDVERVGQVDFTEGV